MCRRLFTRPFPTLSLSLSSRPLRTALLRACSGRTAFSSSLQPTFSRLSFFSPRAFRSPFVSFRIASLSLLEAAAHITSHSARPLAFRLSPLVACSPDHFQLARFPRLAAYIRRRVSRVLFILSFAPFTRSRSRSRLALLRSASLALLLSCLAFSLSLFVPRPLLSSRLDTPHHVFNKIKICES